MTLLVSAGQLAERRALVSGGGTLAPLAASLSADLQPVTERDLWIPPEKARLTRRGGRCERDGTQLAFDPWSPRRHACPRCGAEYSEEEHYRWWIMGYQLWLAERAVHAAALHALLGDEAHRALANAILDRYAETYLQYPNQDNVLGPSRLFFSTYLESIWLLQLCVASSLLSDVDPDDARTERFHDALVAPCAMLIADYDEGLSNRQSWNNAALIAARIALGDRESAEKLLRRKSGVARHLEKGLLEDGSWYEGDNYHLFAHRALWYAVKLAEQAGFEPFSEELMRRFDAGFSVPFRTALPDFTFPARRDSQYQVSLRQWRFAEMAELGLARSPSDSLLAGALHRLYDPDVAPGETGRWRSTAEAERNEPPVRLSRSELGWRSLLFAPAELPALEPVAPATELFGGQGLAIFRRDEGRAYIALDYGHSGGGHGHPDRLNLIFADGETRWLDDPGTGSYVDPMLFWYRSTLAHNAPLVNGVSQQRVHGRLLAFEEKAMAGWIYAEAADAAPGVVLRRAVVAMDGYFVDTLSWHAQSEVQIDLPLHVEELSQDVGEWMPGEAGGSRESTDGFAFISGAQSVRSDGKMMRLRATIGEERADAWTGARSEPFQLWRARGPGRPNGDGPRAFHWLRAIGEMGRIVTTWSWRGAVKRVEQHGHGIVVTLNDGTRHLHQQRSGNWRIRVAAGDAEEVIELGGTVAEATFPGRSLGSREAIILAPQTVDMDEHPRFRLGEESYRRSEATWREAGKPSAGIHLVAMRGMFSIMILVEKPVTDFRAAMPENPLDNEPADINSDGVQLYLSLPSLGADGENAPVAAWLLVPDPSLGEDGVRVTGLNEAASRVPLEVDADLRPGGYHIMARIPMSTLGSAAPRRFGLGVIVNETSPGRERRRGQLVLGGARGERVYLQGVRHDPRRFIPIVIRYD